MTMTREEINGCNEDELRMMVHSHAKATEWFWEKIHRLLDALRQIRDEPNPHGSLVLGVVQEIARVTVAKEEKVSLPYGMSVSFDAEEIRALTGLSVLDEPEVQPDAVAGETMGTPVASAPPIRPSRFVRLDDF